MTSCTIIISHYESIEFLRACIRQVRKYAHPEIEQIIYIAEQSKKETKDIVLKEFGPQEDIVVCNMAPLYSGYGIDVVVRSVGVDTDYIAQLHTDAMPISKNWLSLPIKLIEEYEFSFVGQLQFIADGTAKIYPPDPFCCMAQCFNVAKRETYEEMAEEGGFTRFHQRPFVESGMSWDSKDWMQWAHHDYAKRGSDDDVVAFHWQDKYRIANKLGLSISGMIGHPDDGSSWGRVIENLVFHFGSCREAKGVMDKMPMQYQRFTAMINDGGFTDELLELMLELLIPYKSDRTFWDGTSKVASKANEDLNNRIEKLKHGLD